MDLQTTSMPWCDQCGAYHHTSTPHIPPGGVPIESGFDDPAAKLPPSTGSAVEWVQKKLFPIHDDDGREHWELCKSDALELARLLDRSDERCSEWADIAGKHGAECDKLRAQLAAVQAEATALRVSWHNAQAEARELREALWHYACLDVLTSEQRQHAHAALAKKEGER